MTVRRLVSILSVCLVASVTIVAAQPKKPADKPAPVKPPADKRLPPPHAGSGSGSAAGSAGTAAGSGAGSAAGSAVQMTEDPPPKDIEGRDENPGAVVGEPEGPKLVAVAKAPRVSYPIEEALRPINLPGNMVEVAIGQHVQLSPYQGTDALRARYGITRRVQLGLTYVLGSVFNDHDVDATSADDKQAFHAGKAVGLDLTVLIQDWIGVRLGVPVYVKPLAVSLTLGAPLKFTFGNKFAIGGLDDLLNIKLYRFAPSFYQESINARGAKQEETNVTQSNGQLRISAFGVYNPQPKTALIGRFGFAMENFQSNKQSNGGLSYFLRAGVNYSPKKYLDLGISVGFDDLAETGTFGPAGFLAFRI